MSMMQIGLGIWGSTPRSIHPILDAMTVYWEIDEFSDGSSAVARANSFPKRSALVDINTVPSYADAWGNVAALTAANAEKFASTESSIFAATADREIWLWARPSASGASIDVVASKDDGSTNRDWSIQYEFASEKFRAVIFNTSNNNFVVYSTVAAKDTWHLVSLRLDITGSRIGISVDAGAYTYTTVTGTPRQTISNFSVGGYELNNSYTFDGRLAACGAVNGFLAPASLSWLYSAGRPRTFVEIQSFTG